MSDETLDVRIALIKTLLDLIMVVLPDHSDLAKQAVSVTADNVAGLVDEMAKCMKTR